MNGVFEIRAFDNIFISLCDFVHHLKIDNYSLRPVTKVKFNDCLL